MPVTERTSKELLKFGGGAGPTFPCFLPLDIFDNTEYDCRTPKEWLDLSTVKYFILTWLFLRNTKDSNLKELIGRDIFTIDFESRNSKYPHKNWSTNEFCEGDAHGFARGDFKLRT